MSPNIWIKIICKFCLTWSYCKCITFGCLFFFSVLGGKLLPLNNYIINALRVCTRIGTFRNSHAIKIIYVHLQYWDIFKYFNSLYVWLITAYHRFQSRKHSDSKEIFSSSQIRSLLFRGRMCRFYHFLGLVESAWSKHCYLHHCPQIRQHQIPTSSEGLNLFAIQIKHKEVNSTSFILKHEIAY